MNSLYIELFPSFEYPDGDFNNPVWRCGGIPAGECCQIGKCAGRTGVSHGEMYHGVMSLLIWAINWVAVWSAMQSQLIGNATVYPSF